MNNHTQLLNYLATTFNLQSYLEIGVQDPATNFDKIQCKRRTGVDPIPVISHEQMRSYQNKIHFITSDEFFESNLVGKYHLIFIDGLHHADQVKRDFENSLRCLTDNGFIVIHDTCPEKEEYTHVPRDSKIWNGDVYKFACSLPIYRGIEFCTFEADHGCTVVWREGKISARNCKPVKDWADFQQRKYLLRCCNSEQLKVRIEHLKQNINQLS